MPERINIDEACANLNERILLTRRKVDVLDRGGYWELDEHKHIPERGRWEMQRTLAVGTKKEISGFLHAMVIGIDLSRLGPDNG